MYIITEYRINKIGEKGGVFSNVTRPYVSREYVKSKGTAMKEIKEQLIKLNKYLKKGEQWKFVRFWTPEEIWEEIIIETLKREEPISLEDLKNKLPIKKLNWGDNAEPESIILKFKETNLLGMTLADCKKVFKKFINEGTVVRVNLDGIDKFKLNHPDWLDEEFKLDWENLPEREFFPQEDQLDIMKSMIKRIEDKKVK